MLVGGKNRQPPPSSSPPPPAQNGECHPGPKEQPKHEEEGVGVDNAMQVPPAEGDVEMEEGRKECVGKGTGVIEGAGDRARETKGEGDSVDEKAMEGGLGEVQGNVSTAEAAEGQVPAEKAAGEEGTGEVGGAAGAEESVAAGVGTGGAGGREGAETEEGRPAVTDAAGEGAAGSGGGVVEKGTCPFAPIKEQLPGQQQVRRERLCI